MSYILITVYTKTNAETEINFWDGDPIENLIDTYFDAGKIEQIPVKVVDGLTETWKWYQDNQSEHLSKINYFKGKYQITNPAYVVPINREDYVNKIIIV